MPSVPPGWEKSTESFTAAPPVKYNCAGINASPLCVEKAARMGWVTALQRLPVSRWCGRAGPGPLSAPAPSEQRAEATPPAPCFVCISAEASCKLICCSIVCCCSENQKSLNSQDKCLSLALHDQALTFKLVTYLVGLSKCPLAFISKFSEALKLVRPFRNFLIPCNKLINCVKIQFSFKSCVLRRSSEVSAVAHWRGDTSLNSQGT